VPPARPRLALRQSVQRRAVAAEELPGRLPPYALREILEARTAAASEGRELDLEPFIKE
jgi:hypothetical protein